MKQFTEDEVKELIRNAWTDGWEHSAQGYNAEHFPESANAELAEHREDYVNEVMDEL